MLSRLAPLVAAGIGLLVLAQGVPWPPGERLTYNLTWQGIGVGRVYLSADPVEGGWRFRMKLEPTGLAKALGYGLEAESRVGFDFRTDRFWQNLTEPLKGTTRLMYERQENSGSWARVIQPDGSQTGWVSPNDQLLDQLALIYYLRLRPETRQIVAVDYPKPAQGQLEVLPASNGLVGYRFARDDVLIEVWYRQNAQRTPVRFVFGRDFGRLEATLVENGR
ncbi:DUF3108 domain-containing protein [Meiothermus taiwanensis]|uniref:DUF3108 domain-containing protein n=2 Tax=Meiothermus taiwanensis TaxID=172827 RepID=A0A399DXW8_9DEIN|nr:DUF3108 domain-containing protein [Meiothermus taiwanensis]AWR85561.1 hypothetical protein Mtai_v1c03120 [Meiothermus taiwanensis WR-220]KIQ54029.1 hypothetical protein SY28_10795 [Meiothermus taiwanensis]KZK16383.1 hypothetical protein A3962_00095 [Meiothermus taiwanensis]RIH74870.1 hypothetical protein Mcate_02508 [Meiothermus taiwanensis]